jgi:hypothetical protein
MKWHSLPLKSNSGLKMDSNQLKSVKLSFAQSFYTANAIVQSLINILFLA